MDINFNKKQFAEILASVLDGFEYENIMGFLERTDFFIAPASTRFHLSEEGGLCQHSLNVYTSAMQIDTAFNSGASRRSIAICSLLHDVCKAGVYRKELKNAKNYDKTAIEGHPKFKIKHDKKGDFIWDLKEIYVFDDPWPFGHGSKSAYIVSQLIDLTDEEALAIRYHMGPYEEGDKERCSKVFEQSKLALLIHFADMYASKVVEGENEG
ncbi:MAG: HD domain-containing protein [Candidatus Riflebacteria bacterium]|nr:HD domain-containing protein [Candidatus Riflebacteria bacterium]